jgi:hypothetical protein
MVAPKTAVKSNVGITTARIILVELIVFFVVLSVEAFSIN